MTTIDTTPAAFDFDAVTFVTSDHHFGHARIIELAERPFATLDDMHRVLIDNWNAVIGPHDVVLHLGDLAMGLRTESIPLTSALNGRKLLLPGNHDTISAVYKSKPPAKQETLYLLAQAGWEVVPENLIGHRNGHQVLASHYPYLDDSRGPVRHGAAHPADAGLPLIHGHTHSRGGGPHGRMYHVGVDGTDFTPVAMTTIDEWLASLANGS